MRILRPADEAEVVGVFLRGELDSERFGPAMRLALERDRVEADVVERPDLSDEEANAYRRRLLGELRGWGRSERLFGGFPERVEWFRAAVTPDEVGSIRFIDWDWWLTVSGGSRLATDTAARIRAGEVPGVTAEEHAPIARRLTSGPPLPELIVVRRDAESHLVVLEGHVRLTAFALFPEALPAELEVFLGESPDLDGWSEY